MAFQWMLPDGADLRIYRSVPLAWTRSTTRDSTTAASSPSRRVFQTNRARLACPTSTGTVTATTVSRAVTAGLVDPTGIVLSVMRVSSAQTVPAMVRKAPPCVWICCIGQTTIVIRTLKSWEGCSRVVYSIWYHYFVRRKTAFFIPTRVGTYERDTSIDLNGIHGYLRLHCAAKLALVSHHLRGMCSQLLGTLRAPRHGRGRHWVYSRWSTTCSGQRDIWIRSLTSLRQTRWLTQFEVRERDRISTAFTTA